MKLLSLWIEAYKNLRNFGIDFSPSGVTVLIGANGSGKSNVLEALSEIFRGLYESTAPQLKFRCKICYEKGGKKISFAQTSSTLALDACDITAEDYAANRFEYLPSQVIASYSGETDRLWKGFYEQIYLKYTASLLSNRCEKLKMLYANHYHWSMALLLLSVYAEDQYKALGFPPIKRVGFRFADQKITKTNEVSVLLGKLGYVSKGEKEFGFEEIKHIFESEYGAAELFNALSLALLPKEKKLIEEISIGFETFTLDDLSEGEKKLALLSALYQLIADGDTLVLLDEPDTYVHEMKKPVVKELTEKFIEQGVCTVMSTHSSALAPLYGEGELKGLQKTEQGVTVTEGKDLNLLKGLFGDSLSQLLINEYIQSEKPFLLLEGKDDVNYIQKALKVLKNIDDKYQALDFHIQSFNGAGNAQYFKEHIGEILAGKKYIYVFDRDQAGREALSKFLGIKKESFDNTKEYFEIEDGVVGLLYPPSPESDVDKNFLVEDYFSETCIQEIIQEFLVTNKSNRYRSAPKLGDWIKSGLGKRYEEGKLADSEFENFRPLLDMLLKISNAFRAADETRCGVESASMA